MQISNKQITKLVVKALRYFRGRLTNPSRIIAILGAKKLICNMNFNPFSRSFVFMIQYYLHIFLFTVITADKEAGTVRFFILFIRLFLGSHDSTPRVSYSPSIQMKTARQKLIYLRLLTTFVKKKKNLFWKASTKGIIVTFITRR